jgi:hypothetical protein
VEGGEAEVGRKRRVVRVRARTRERKKGLEMLTLSLA